MAIILYEMLKCAMIVLRHTGNRLGKSLFSKIMLTKSDIKAIKGLLDTSINTSLRPLKTDVSGIKKDVSVLKKDVSILKTDVSILKKDVHDIKQDTTDIKLKVNDFAKTALDALGNLLEWTDDIHRANVREKLPERVKQLEQIIKIS